MTQSIFITGAASGIGRATAKRFHQEGWHVGAFDLDQKGLAGLRAELGSERVTTGSLDVVDYAAMCDSVKSLVQAAGRLDVIFNSAGLLSMGTLEEIPVERSRRIAEVNCFGAMNGVYAALPHLKQSKGTIVSMCSASAIYGQPEMMAYSASKFFIRGLTESLELELKKDGIRVTDIMPSYVQTPMVANQERRSGTLNTMGANLTPERIAEVVWKAVKGRRIHNFPEFAMAFLYRSAGFAPRMTRGVVRLLSK
jgi:NADP-dependent 3-hydroxy acid dehydrogenase YdfG